MQVVNVNSRRLVDLFALIVLVSSAKNVRHGEDYKKNPIGVLAFNLAGAIAIDLRNKGVDADHATAAASHHLHAIVPVGFTRWPPKAILTFASHFTKKVVNGGWFPDSKIYLAQEFVQEMYNMAVRLEDIDIESKVQAVYDKALARGMFSRR